MSTDLHLDWRRIYIMTTFAKPQEAREIEARSRARERRVRVYVIEPEQCYWTLSQSDQGIYHLTHDRNGWECECDGYAYTGVCKHLAQLERRSEREGWVFGKIAPLPVPATQ
jgi:hypothetical protein